MVGALAETIAATQRLLAQTDQRLDGNRVIPDRPTEFGYTLLLAEDERGLSPTTKSNRGTHRMRRSWCRRSGG